MNRSAPSILLVAAATIAAAPALPNPLAAQGETNGTLLSLHVPCREEPSPTASVVSVFRQTGDAYWETVSVRDSTVDAAGTTWVSVRRTPYMPRLCWIPETLVGPWREPESVLAMADRLLASPDGRPLEDWVAVYNYFQHRVYREAVEASVALSIRKLEVLMRALEAAQPSPARDLDPRALAWFGSLGAEVEAVEDRFGRPRWLVSRAAFDALYEAHRESPQVEEILWRTARDTLQRGDCGPNSPCVPGGTLSGLASYLRSYPNGRFVDDAVSMAFNSLRRAGGGLGILRICERARDAQSEVVRRQRWEWWDGLAWESEGGAAARRLLAALGEMGEEENSPLVDYLNRVERCALEVAARPPPPQESPRARAEVAVEQESAPPPDTRELAIIAPGVPCRVEPSRTERTDVVLRLDEHFTTELPDTVAAGEAWVSVRRWGDCWVPRAETALADTAGHVLAIADRFLTSDEGRMPDYSLRVYNVLGSRAQGHREVVDGSGILSLRRLQILRQVLKTFHSEDADALLRGWADQLGDDVEYWSIGLMWLVRDEALERVYEEHRDSPEAEDVLWELASGAAMHDCEGDFTCWAQAEVLDRVARYWTAFPQGRRVAAAVRRASERLAWVAGPGRACSDEWTPRDATTLSELRATLASLSPADAEPLTTLLDRLEACAS